MFSKKATKIDEIFTVNLTVTTYRQIDGEDYVNFCGLLRKRELKSPPKIFWNAVKVLNISEEFKKLNQYKFVNSKSKIYIEIMLICMLNRMASIQNSFEPLRIKHEL